MTTKGPARRYYVRFQDGTFRPVTASSKQDAVDQFMKQYRPPKGSLVWVRPQVPLANETGDWQQFKILSGPATLEESGLVRRPRRDSAAALAQAQAGQGRRIGPARGVLHTQPQQVYPQPPQVVVQFPGYPPTYPQMQTPVGPPPPAPPYVPPAGAPIDMTRRVGPARAATTGTYRAAAAPTIPPPPAAPPLSGPPPAAPPIEAPVVAQVVAAPTPAQEAPIGPQYGPVYSHIQRLIQAHPPTGYGPVGSPGLTKEEIRAYIEQAMRAIPGLDPRVAEKIIDMSVKQVIASLKRGLR